MPEAHPIPLAGLPPPGPLNYNGPGRTMKLGPGQHLSLAQSPDAPLCESPRAIEAKFAGPEAGTPYDFDKEKPGRRPDTLLVQGLPYAW